VLATADEARGERLLTLPSLLPGRRFMSLHIKRNFDNNEIVIGSLDRALDVRLPAVQSNE
jgi:hypothetical protein